MGFEDWERLVPQTLREDPLWRMRVYRLALYTADIGWGDVSKLSADRRTYSLADQLYRSVGSISANIAEGYSRASSRDQARFYEYALGSARESRDWYYKARHVLGESVVDERMKNMSEVSRQLLSMIAIHRPR